MSTPPPTTVSTVVGGVLAAAQEQLPEDVGKAGPIGLALIVCLLVAVLLLGRSMGRHLERLPASFDPADDLPPVPDTPAELFETSAAREPGVDLLDSLRRAPKAIEPPRRPDPEDRRG